VLRVSVDDFLTLNVVQVVFEDVFTQQVNQSLDILGHLLVGSGFFERGEVDVGESSLKERNVKLIREEHLHIVNWLFNT
jgi:hypothetical protein